ncbi:ABC transporter ATP-binding protein/permease [Marinilongibacter aquaticus]|uniref:peptidase domain-containing ABC transporter n=1 Tax=Marinilongibacter aquaticus TaxID=2975157 RepID=UPI0021BD6435|nr:ABC transporter ATP-binding protein [Marinilongibacter aquaticus]UBM58922.1 ABC transporter ATP-binding protein/permease [Marinilongibacter aquaticus]
MEKNSLNIGSAIRRIFNILEREKRDIYAIYVFSILAGLVALSLPLGIQTIIGFVMAGRLSTSIVILIILVLAGTLLTGLFQVRQLQLIETIEQKLFTRYAFAYADRLPSLKLEALDNYYLPELVNRFFDVVSLQKSLRKILIDIPASVFQIILGTILLSFYHPLFIAFGITLMVIVVLIFRFTSKEGFMSSIQTSDYKYATAAWFQEMARGIKTFKFARKSELHLSRTNRLTSSYLDARSRHFQILKLQYWSLIAFKLLITAAMLILGVMLLVNNQINIGQFIASDIVIISIISSIEKLIMNMDQVYESLTAVLKLSKVAEAELEENGSFILSSNAPLQVEFRNVHYAYPNSDEILHKIDFSLNSGEWMLIHGPSGSGKSTVMRLMSGSYSDFEGQILLNELPIRNYDNQSLRSKMGILLGNQNIFYGTLLENLTLNNGEVNNERLMKVAHYTGLDTFIENTEHGFDTIVDPLGKRLNSEIRHKILLTRALASKSSLYLLENPFRFCNPAQMENLVSFLKSEESTFVIAQDTEANAQYFDKKLNLSTPHPY